MTQTEKEPSSAIRTNLKDKVRKLFSSRFFRIGLICGILTITAFAGYGIWKYGFSESPHSEKAATAFSSSGIGHLSNERAVFDLPGITPENVVFLEPFRKITLSDSGSPVCVDLNVSVEISSPELEVELKEKMFILHEIVVSSIKEHVLEGIQTIEGKISLKKELLEKLNGVLENGRIQALFFSDFLIEFEA
jgi:flagellar FliL protein